MGRGVRFVDGESYGRRVLVAGAAVVSLAGCGRADLAVLGAPPCPEGASARPERQRERPAGTVWAWAPLFQAPEGTPRQGAVPGLSDVVSIADGGHTMVAVRGDGTVWSYGTNAAGSLGHGSRERHYLAEPRRVTGIGPAHAVYGSGTTFHVVLRDGTVTAWGRGAGGALGDGDRPDHASARPVRVNGLPEIRRIAAHGLTGYAVDTAGGLWAWGSGLTLGEHASRTARPVRVPLPGPALDVSGHHAIIGTE